MYTYFWYSAPTCPTERQFYLLRMWSLLLSRSRINCDLLTPHGDTDQGNICPVMACCLTAPSHYLDQCWLMINGRLWHSHERKFTGHSQEFKPKHEVENHTFKITSIPPRRQWVNTLRPGQNGLHFADNIFKCIFLNENVWIPIKISLKFVPKGPINNIPALVQIMAWRRSGHKPLSEPMMVRLPTHIYICVTRPQWVKYTMHGFYCW